MGAIRLLPRHLVNKIAAGEVIERPASVVKELVENSIDAGATAIDIVVEDGGRRLISVRDNGAGMGPEDLELAFAPHATSKIASEEDLFNIRTMGFRGEALASIAAIAHAHILSRRRTEEHPSETLGGRMGETPMPHTGETPVLPEEINGYEIRSEDETVGPVKPAAAAQGTTVTAADLFYNTPARRKFLRSAETEFGHVVEQLARLALPFRQVAFSLTHNGRQTHQLPATDDLRRRVADFFGPELAQATIPVAEHGNDLTITGLICLPAAARASGKWQYFFVNGRYVRDKFLSHALKEAYRGLIDPSRSPVGFIFLELDPSSVDVNVHPAKVEVRFRDSQAIHSHLLAGMKEALNRSGGGATVAFATPAGNLPAEGEPGAQLDDARRQSLKQALADFFKSQPPPQSRLDFPAGYAQGQWGGRQQSDRPAEPAWDGPAFPGSHPASSAQAATAADHVNPAAHAAPAQSTPPDSLAAGLPSAIQIHNSYIVTATPEGLAIVDQHALHERIIFEDLSRRLASGPLAAQRLLIPEVVAVTAPEKAVLAEQAPLLERLGLEFTEFGPDSLAVQKFPSLLADRRVGVAEFVRQLLDLLAEHTFASADQLLEKLLATMACKAAVKAGDALTSQEIQALLARGATTGRQSACPHGRPTTLNLTLNELEKQFKRT